MDDQVIDRTALDRLLAAIGGDPDDLHELLEEFESLAPTMLKKMQIAARDGDLNALRISAHSLKSNARDFGAAALATECETTEHDAASGRIDDPVARVAAIETELARARTALAEITARHG